MYKLLPILLAFLFAANLQGQRYPTLYPKIQRYTPEDYDAANQVWSLAQTPNGTLYTANAAGVLSFDGVRWRKLFLPGRPIVRAITYHGGRLYAGGYGQFGYFTGLDDVEPTYVSLSEQLPADQREEEIWNIQVLDDGTVVFHSFARLYAYQNDRITENLAPGIILFAFNEGDKLTIPIIDKGLHQWVPGRGFQLLPGSEALGRRNVSNVVTWDDGYLVGTEDTTFLYANETITPTALPPKVNRLLRLRGGGLAVGTINDGVYLFTRHLRPRHHITREEGLGNNTVLSLHEDESGKLWVGLDQGLVLIDLSGTLLYSGIATAESGTVYAAAEHGGEFYIGTNQGVFLSAGDEMEQIEGLAGQVWELATTGGELICAHNDGVSTIEGGRATLIDGTTGTWELVPHPTKSGLYAQASYTGFSLLRRTPGGLDSRRLAGTAAPFRFATWLNGTQLLAAHTARGLYRLRLRKDLSGYSEVTALPANDMAKPFIATFGDTVLAQNVEGVFHYDGGLLKSLGSFRGVALPEGALCLAGRPERGDWFSVAADRVAWYRYGTLLAEVPIRLAADYPVILPWMNDGYLLGLNDGYAILSPDESAPVVRRMLLRGRATGRDAYRLEAALPVFDRTIRYRHRLLGRTDEWSEWSEQASWQFSSLWEGDYVLEVEADWFEASARHAFTVRPPWYRGTLAYLLYGVAAVLLSLALYRWHRRRLRDQAKRLELVRRRQLQRQEMEARNQKLEENVASKNRELANTTLSLAKKNEMLLQLRQELEQGRTDKVRHLIDRNLNDQEDWAIFEDHFNEVHDAYLRRLRQLHPSLTSGELQLAAYLKMDLASKEIAPLLHISLRGVENKRYRLRKKLNIGAEQNLNQYLMDL